MLLLHLVMLGFRLGVGSCFVSILMFRWGWPTVLIWAPSCGLITTPPIDWYIIQKVFQYSCLFYLLWDFLWFRRFNDKTLRACLALERGSLLCGCSVIGSYWGAPAGHTEVLCRGALGLAHTSIGRRDRIDGLAILESHVAVVVEHAHRSLQIHKLDRVNASNLLIRRLLHEDKLVKLFSCRVLRMAQDLSWSSQRNTWLEDYLWRNVRSSYD